MDENNLSSFHKICLHRWKFRAFEVNCTIMLFLYSGNQCCENNIIDKLYYAKGIQTIEGSLLNSY